MEDTATAYRKFTFGSSHVQNLKSCLQSTMVSSFSGSEYDVVTPSKVFYPFLSFTNFSFDTKELLFWSKLLKLVEEKFHDEHP